MLKQLRSPHRERAVEGVRNAAWDISSSLFHYGDEADGRDMLADRLSSWWTPEDAGSIAKAYCAYLDRLDEPTRHKNGEVQGDYISDLITAGERRLLDWQPASHS